MSNYEGISLTQLGIHVLGSGFRTETEWGGRVNESSEKSLTLGAAGVVSFMPV